MKAHSRRLLLKENPRTAIRFDTVHGAQLAERLQNTDGWKALPLEEELELLMYGGNRHYRTLNVMFCSAFLQFVVYCFK